jgi:hypothetical protein
VRRELATRGAPGPCSAGVTTRKYVNIDPGGASGIARHSTALPCLVCTALHRCPMTRRRVIDPAVHPGDKLLIPTEDMLLRMPAYQAGPCTPSLVRSTQTQCQVWYL